LRAPSCLRAGSKVGENAKKEGGRKDGFYVLFRLPRERRKKGGGRGDSDLLFRKKESRIGGRGVRYLLISS